MRNFFILFILILILIATVFINVPSVYADESILYKVGDAAKFDVTEAKDPLAFSIVVGRFINVFLSMIGIIFTVLIIYGGYLWMMAKGNSEEVEKAKEIFKNAAIGLVVVISAYAITYFILNVLVSKYTTDKSIAPKTIQTQQ